MTRLSLLLLTLGLLTLGGAALATHYLFQEPAYVTWSRYLAPEFRWQRQKYPSLRWAFDLIEPLIIHNDPRTRFAAASQAPALAAPDNWNNDLLGPQSGAASGPAPTVLVSSAGALKSAIAKATPGTVIELQPGVYEFSGSSLQLGRGGTAAQPIVLRAAVLGSARLRFNLVEGFHVQAPHWTFENLVIEGACKNDSRCEHAFHVVGDAAGTVIRNNWVVDFNASVKVNSKNNRFPDQGLIEHNAFVNNRPRDTANPVTLLDIVAVNGWQVRKNVIADFAKAGGNHVSYGVFFKGAGEDNVFEQNFIRCEWQHRGGARVGFSFGNGGTGARYCRDGRCDVEHRGGIVRNNIIMDCPNEVGIYLHKSADTLIHNNALINTRGIDLRSSQTFARIVNNIIDGRILSRDGGRLSTESNIVSPFKAIVLGKVSSDIYGAPAAGDFRLKDLGAAPGKGVALGLSSRDLCDQPPRAGAPDIGPIQYGGQMSCQPIIP